MTRFLSSLLLIVGCSGSVEPPVVLPSTCSVQAEYIRVQLCPKQSVAVVCTNVGQTNFAPAHCDGPDWTEGKQITGNLWCCDAELEPVASKCDPLWSHCVESGLTVECVSNGAESLCTCQGTLDGKLAALACHDWNGAL